MKRILVVEDDVFIRDMVTAKLAQSSFNVESATTGEEALAAVDENPPDLMLLDLKIPGISGDEVLKKMKLDNKLPETPVVVFSNNDEQSAMEEALKMGASAYFVKVNTDLNELVTKINELVST